MSKSDYEELKKKWYGILKESGFEDIEQKDGNLKDWDSIKFVKNNNIVSYHNHKQKADYYYYATHFLHQYKFDKEIHKFIWEEHTKGLGVRTIAKLLNKDGAFKVNKDDVWKIISHYRAIMKKQLGVTSADFIRSDQAKKKTKP